MIELKKEDEMPTDGVIKFWATWCGPCKQLAPIVENLDTTANIYGVDVEVIPSLASRFRIMSVPTLVYLKGGKPLKIESGVKTAEEILLNIRELGIE